PPLSTLCPYTTLFRSNVARGEQVHLHDLLQEVQRPELPAVPDHSFADHHDARDHDVFEVGAEERLLPWVPGHEPLGLDLLEDRRSEEHTSELQSLAYL